MAAFSKRLKGAMSSYFDAGGKESNGKSSSVFLTEVPSGTADLAADEEDSTSRGKRKKLEVRLNSMQVQDEECKFDEVGETL